MNMRFPFDRSSASVGLLRMRFCFILVVWLCAMVRASGELAVGKPEWGFNGAVVENSFNLLTVEVRNTGSGAFEGELVLDDGGPFGGSTSAPYKQQVFIAPGAARFVQFYPYLTSSFGDWTLRWETAGGGREKFENLKRDAPAVVILIDPAGIGARSLKMQAFNESHFPSTVAATNGLHAVVLDHQPRWDAARREAFLDWFRKGGIVHVLPGPDGTVPQFSDEFAVLNTTGPATVGTGLVVKHAIPTGEITEAILAKAGYPSPVLPDYSGNQREHSDHGLFRKLGTVTKANIAWGTIYGLTAIYVLLIGPVFFFLRKRDYRKLLVGFLLTVGLFAWIFTAVGRRGYGEKQIYHSLAIAQSVGGARWDVRHWVHAFATTGDEYRFHYAGPSQLYAAISQGDSVRGAVLLGKDAEFTADIPLFSSRPFLHQGVLTGPDLGLKLDEFKATSNRTVLQKLRIKTGAQFPSAPIVVVVQYRGQYHQLQKDADGWTLAGNSASLGHQVFNSEIEDFRMYGGEAPESARAWLRNGAGVLGRFVSLNSGSRQYPHRLLRADQIRVFVYTDTPRDFPLVSDDFEAGIGYVLYVQDLTLPPNDDAQKLATDGSPTRH
jgi:hypothetical protein